MQPRKPQTAAGILLAISLVAGAAIGVAQGEPSIGLIAGLGVGIVVAALSVVLKRRR